MLSRFPLELEVTWLLQYRGLAYRNTVVNLVERFGRDTIVAELVKRASDAGGNVVSIASARNWQRPQPARQGQRPRVM